MKKKVKTVNVLGPRLKHVVRRTFGSVTSKTGPNSNPQEDGDAGSNCSGGGADCANCGNCSNN